MEILESGAVSAAYRALDALKYQQSLQSKNIAYSEVKGFEAQLLDLQSVLAATEAQGGRSIDPDTLARHTSKVDIPVEVDSELLQMQETVLRYKAIIDLMSRRGELMGSVMGSSK